MDTKTGRIYTVEEFEKQLQALPNERMEELKARVVEVSAVVAEKMRLGNKAYKRKIKREKVKALKLKQRK